LGRPAAFWLIGRWRLSCLVRFVGIIHGTGPVD
jgi:hypothetical protein